MKYGTKLNKIGQLINIIDILLNIIHILLVKRLPVSCPSCDGKLTVKQLLCEKCETEVEGLYPLPTLAALPLDDQEFIIEFMTASGSLKEMAAILKVSYPTVRNRLDEIIGKLKRSQASSKEGK